ncbi:hypothetical protein HMPREF1318_2416 [Actinomyces massiliensis F0489]|uniref:Uncharacterized protein n=1 Tax=Actinomyces massiliensis F0489 TaxID=1125718 RepID=J1HL56_9ACTO|nr:hypothetical protein HMPREF1318_2416 [Actinomyces massiliensis F0489]
MGGPSLGAELDRSRRGVRPISVRKWTDFGADWRAGLGVCAHS